MIRIAIRLLLGVALVVATAWASLALWFDGPAWRPLAAALGAGFALAALALFLRLRPLRRAVLGYLLAWAIVLGWWLSIAPQSARRWQPDVALVATAEVAGDRVTVHNVRNFDYRTETDYTERWEDRTLDLSRLRGLDLFISFWGPSLIAHTILSWEFDGGDHLAISIETRKEEGESYSALRGFFRQYELYYVVADERDVIGLRASHRGEQLFLYRLRGTPVFARELLLDYLAEVNRIAERPKWYNAVTQNCTTTIRLHVDAIGVRQPWDWRLLANGRSDELLYTNEVVNTTLPFPELKAKSDVTARARAAAGDPAFSERLREGLPSRP